jgi:membrane fusion protein (multidrug efflux system)
MIITILLITVVAVIIFYPKLKPLFSSKPVVTAGGAPGAGPGRGAGPGAAGGRQALNVSGFLIQPASMNEFINSLGTLKPDEEVELSFETSGKIVNLNFTEGTRVKKGDLLAKINDKPLQAQLEKLKAQQKLVSEKEFRQRSLLEKDAISQESYDQIVTEMQTIQADINLVTARISETELRAPFDGILGLRNLSEGSFATTSTKIARLVKMSPIKLEFSIPERYANDVNVGFPITFTVDNKPYQANVYAIDPKIELNTRSIAIRALYPNKNEELKSGRFASVTLRLAHIENTIAIPTEALIPEMGGEMVYIYRKGRASSVKVNVGLRTESLIQIVSGLNFGDTLLTSGILQLRQGLPVVLDTLVTKR